LGLAPDEYEQLALRVDAIFHNGALVDHSRLYRALRGANVQGTMELLHLANHGRGCPFHFISTLSVFEAPGYHDVAQVEESDEPSDPLCHDSYAQSKLVAERLVYQAGQRGMPVTIHRLAMCTGDSRTGLGGGQGLFARFFSGAIDLGVAPLLELDTWLTPVDYVAKAVRHLAFNHRGTAPGVFHLGCPAPIPYEWLVKALNQAGCAVSAAPFNEWRATALERSTPADPLYPMLPFLTDDIQGHYGRGHRPQLSSARTAEILARGGIVCPAMTEELMGRYVEHWKEIGLIGGARQGARVGELGTAADAQPA
jgi:thioester reductase-like protein